MENKGKSSRISVRKVRLSPSWSSQNSQVPSRSKQRLPIRTFTKISQTWPV